jgi:decaprenylphospho-beta-D-erythro-pentofuranosid-2-ulose 2-reductase
MASKAGLSTYLDSLRFRLARHGVRVVSVKPGYVDTPMLGGLKTPRPLTITPDRAAAAIVRAARTGAPTAYVPGYWAPIMWLIRHLPRALVARMPD